MSAVKGKLMEGFFIHTIVELSKAILILKTCSHKEGERDDLLAQFHTYHTYEFTLADPARPEQFLVHKHEEMWSLGDMIEAVLRTKALELAYRAVHASRGKITRAEPISALYEQKRVHHVGIFGALESEMTDYNPATSTKSPDRMDALVWAITELSGAAASGTVFRNFWTPDLIYSDATRPPSLGNAGGFVAKYVLITYGTNNTTYFTEVIDDGAVLWFDREYAWDAVREAKHRTNAEQVEELQQFIQDTRKTELLLSSSALSLQGELTKRGLWFTEVESSEEDLVEGIRIASSMMSRQLFRVHHRCLHLLSQIGTYSWDQRKLANGAEVPLKGDDFAVAPAMILVKNKIPMWRLSS